MALDIAKLQKILQKGDLNAVARFFDSASEVDRQAAAPTVVEWCERLNLNWQAQFNDKAAAKVQKQGPIADWAELRFAAFAAALASASLAQIKSLDDYADLLMDHKLGRWQGGWKQVRALVRAGLCKPPRHDNYVLDAINGIWPRYQREKSQPLLIDLLLKERDWLESDFWRLFELEGNSEVSLANGDKFGKGEMGWSQALVELSRRGVLSRDRLLDASLHALSRDFIQFRSSWFSRFHEFLEPTVAERAERLEDYLRLVGSSIPPTVAFAVNAIAIIDKNKPIGAKKLLRGLQPALSARGKAVVKTAIQLLKTAVRREPAVNAEVCLAVLPALLNEATDVQKAVLDALDACGDKQDPVLRAKIAEFSGAVAASLKPRLETWVGQAVAPRAAASLTISQRAVSGIDPARAIQPIENLDDLIDLASAVLEDNSDPDQIERLLDGITHLGSERPDDFLRRVEPLRKRALQRRGDGQPRWNRAPALDRALSMFLLTWIDSKDAFNETPENLAGGQNEFAFLFRRLIAVSRQLMNGHNLPLVSAPTHTGGWIDPRSLAQRWIAWQKADMEPDLHEQVLALLRLAPENRQAALPMAKNISGECGEALRYALGARERIGKKAPLWLAACRSRQPHGDLPDFESKHPRLGPDAGAAANYIWGVNAERCSSQTSSWTTLNVAARVKPKPREFIADALLPVLFHADNPRGEENARPLMRWASLLWPANREATFARGASRLASSVNYADVNDRDIAAYLDPLLDPHTELRPMACLALALGLAAEGNALRGLAQDALIAVISESRLNAPELGATMSALLDTGANKLARWSKSLRQVASVSPAHAHAAADLLSKTLHGDPAKAPRDISALLEALFELLSETGGKLQDPAARAYITGLQTGGKTAKLAKQLLAI